MATAIELLRTSSAANTPALQRWAQGVSRVLDSEPGPPDSLTQLLRMANLPSGAAFTRWAEALSHRLDNLVRDGGGISPAELDSLLRLIGGSYQKLPIGDLLWAYLAAAGG